MLQIKIWVGPVSPTHRHVLLFQDGRINHNDIISLALASAYFGLECYWGAHGPLVVSSDPVYNLNTDIRLIVSHLLMPQHQLTAVSPQDILRKIPLFQSLAPEELDFVVTKLTPEQYTKGQIVFEAGDLGDSLYLIASGEIGVVRPDGTLIAVMGPGQFVGDIALILGQPRTATLEVTLDARLWVLKKSDFDHLLDTRPSIALEMLRELSRRLVKTTRQREAGDRRRITAIAGSQKGMQLSLAIYAHLRSPIGLLVLPRARMEEDPAGHSHIRLIEGDHLTETTLADNLSRQIENFQHIVLQLPDQPDPLVLKAVDLADTIVSIGEPPAWLSDKKDEAEVWVTGDTMAEILKTARRLTNRTIGLALSSGGARGLAHIGVIRVLREEQIPIDMIAGSSAGALFGAMVAIGWSDDEIIAYIQDLRSLTRLENWDFNIPPLTGLVKGRRAHRKYLDEPLNSATFEELKIPLSIIAADILTGEEIVINSGSVADAIRASVSIPVLPDPWYYQGHYLVDGGLVNPLPASVLRDQGADIVIGSSVVQPLKDSYSGSKEKMPTMLQTISNIFASMEAEIIKEQLPLIDVLIHHNVSARHTFDFEQAGQLIRSGEDAARQMLPLIRQVLKAPEA